MAHENKYLHMENYLNRKRTFYKQHFFCLISSKNAKKTDTDQSMLQTYKLLKVAALKRSLPSVFNIDTTWKQYFLHKFIISHGIGGTTMLLCSLKQVF